MPPDTPLGPAAPLLPDEPLEEELLPELPDDPAELLEDEPLEADGTLELLLLSG